MKKTKIIIPALGMLLLSTAASVTGTVAWFSANTSVNAEGMTVKVATNATYLLVSHDTSDTAPTAATIQAENSDAGFTSIDLTPAANTEPVALYPVAPAATFTAAQGQTPASHTEYAAGTGIAAPSYWYTMVGTNNVNGTGVSGSEALVSSSDYASYFLKYTFHFTIAVGANSATNLRVDEITMKNPSDAAADAALRCLVVGTNGSVLYSASDTNDSLALESNLTPTTVASVSVYIYYDGNASTIYTQNMANILNGIVDIKFTVTA